MGITQIIAWTVILLVVWYVGKPIVGAFWLSSKNRRGIPTTLSLEQVVELLEKFPWVEEQNIRIETVPMFEAPPQPRIHLNMVQGEADIYVEEGHLCGEPHTSKTEAAGMLKEFRNAYLQQFEIRQILEYLAHCADPSFSDYHEAEDLKEKSRKVTQMWGRSEKIAKSGVSLARLGACVLIIGMIVLLFFHFQNKPVNDLKNVVFKDYGSITLGEAVDKYMRNEEWSKEKIDSTHYRVTLSGFIPKEYANISITFDINYANDRVYASAKQFVWNDVFYDNTIMIAQALEAIYGGDPWLL